MRSRPHPISGQEACKVMYRHGGRRTHSHAADKVYPLFLIAAATRSSRFRGDALCKISQSASAETCPILIGRRQCVTAAGHVAGSEDQVGCSGVGFASWRTPGPVPASVTTGPGMPRALHPSSSFVFRQPTGLSESGRNRSGTGIVRSRYRADRSAAGGPVAIESTRHPQRGWYLR
jgi:hypothetical protein